MKLFILAVSLAIMQAAPPVPGKTPDASTPASQSIQNHADDKKTPTATPLPSPQPTATPIADKKGSDASGTNAEHTVRIGEPVPVSVIKDWADYLGIFSSFLLFIIGGLGVCYAVKTLRAIEKQAELMEGQLTEMQGAGTQAREQLALAQKNVDYIATTERAWIMGELSWWEKRGPNAEEDKDREGRDRTTVFVKLTCRNEGKSPAWIDEVYSDLDIGSNYDERDVDDSFRPPEMGKNGPMGPLGAKEVRSHGVILICLGHRKENESFSAYVIVEYRDIFGIKRETILGYSIDSNGNIDRQNALRNRNRNT